MGRDEVERGCVGWGEVERVGLGWMEGHRGAGCSDSLPDRGELEVSTFCSVYLGWIAPTPFQPPTTIRVSRPRKAVGEAVGAGVGNGNGSSVEVDHSGSGRVGAAAHALQSVRD